MPRDTVNNFCEDIESALSIYEKKYQHRNRKMGFSKSQAIIKIQALLIALKATPSIRGVITCQGDIVAALDNIEVARWKNNWLFGGSVLQRQVHAVLSKPAFSQEALLKESTAILKTENETFREVNAALKEKLARFERWDRGSQEETFEALITANEKVHVELARMKKALSEAQESFGRAEKAAQMLDKQAEIIRQLEVKNNRLRLENARLREKLAFSEETTLKATTTNVFPSAQKALARFSMQQ